MKQKNSTILFLILILYCCFSIQFIQSEIVRRSYSSSENENIDESDDDNSDDGESASIVEDSDGAGIEGTTTTGEDNSDGDTTTTTTTPEDTSHGEGSEPTIEIETQPPPSEINTEGEVPAGEIPGATEPPVATTSSVTTPVPKPTEDDDDDEEEEVTKKPKGKKKSKSKGKSSSIISLPPEVDTKNGKLVGKLVTVKTITMESRIPIEKEVYAFLGIPFAKPPEGELRFKRPVKKGKWTGVFNATSLPNTCPQNPLESFPGFPGEEMWNPNTKISEDCLYLNIWVPAHIFQNKGTPSVGTATVLFWLHGGGFYSGSSTLDVYDGASLAANQNVIVTSTQYRLGALGFIYFGNEDAPGNVGLLDQNLALQWINDNIVGFGGNPADVTLFGESAGAASVSYQLLSPLSRSYFKRAILMSGTATASWSFRSKLDATDVSYKVAKEVGCWADDSRNDVSQVIECLRKIDYKTLVNSQALHVTKILELPFLPTLDDYFILDTPENLVQSWDTKKTDILIGTVADEGTFFSLYAYQKYFSRHGTSPVSYDVFITTLRDVFRDRPAYERDAIVTQYSNWKNLDDGLENHKRLSEAVGDAFFVCPCREFARKWAGRGLNVYYYSFTERSSTSPWAEWMGVMHGDEIEYAFGQPIKSSDREESEINVSLKFMEFLTNFAKNGTPSNNWAKYTPLNQVFLNINGSTISDHTESNVYGPRASECAFWNNYLPRLRHTVEINSCTGGLLRPPNSLNRYNRHCVDRINTPLSRRGKYGW